jgi:hypothetical protein
MRTSLLLTTLLFSLSLAAPAKHHRKGHHHGKGGKGGNGGSDSTTTQTSTDLQTATVTQPASSESTPAGSDIGSSPSAAAPSPVASDPATSSSNPVSANTKWAVGEPFQIVLDANIDPTTEIQPSNVDVFDIDMFNTPADTIAMLKSQGKQVICYFSAGTAENWRPDYDQFTADDLGGGVCEDDSCSTTWPGELWLNVKNPDPTSSTVPSVWSIMAARIQLAASKGCDGVDPDNMGKYVHRSFITISNVLF